MLDSLSHFISDLGARDRCSFVMRQSFSQALLLTHLMRQSEARDDAQEFKNGNAASFLKHARMRIGMLEGCPWLSLACIIRSPFISLLILRTAIVELT